MGKFDQPGYPLPGGDLGEDEIVCQLVFLPDRDEYWQALLGAIHYMSTWRAWERDDDKRGKDAAANWREAFELTIGCWRMACLEQLQQDVSDILALLRSQDACCGDIVTYYDNSTYITIIVPGDGEDPDFYGETAVADWAEWSEYLCHNANLWVDELVRAALTISTALSTGGITIGLLAAVMAAIAFFVVGGVLALPLLMVVVFSLSLEVSSIVFDDAAVDIEDARDEIICAILTGRDVGAAVEAALSSGAAWDLLYTHLDYDSATAILYEGGDGDTVFLEAEKDDTCACQCLHFYSHDPGNNPVTYQSSSGAQWVMERWTSGGKDNRIVGSFFVNKIQSGAFCGTEKTIDSISVSDGLSFARITTFDQNDDPIDDFVTNGVTCSEAIGQLVGLSFAEVYFNRLQASDGGCGAGDITITMTYHDTV